MAVVKTNRNFVWRALSWAVDRQFPTERLNKPTGIRAATFTVEGGSADGDDESSDLRIHRIPKRAKWLSAWVVGVDDLELILVNIAN